MTNPRKRYPFKFLDAYTRKDKEFFFGREEEVETLYEMVFQSDLILVYGASGTGKTSLIQCGLACKFESHDWLPVNIRRGDNINSSLSNALKTAGGESSNESNELAWLDDDLSQSGNYDNQQKSSTLSQQLRSIYLKHFKPIYLIFDQFEELYIIGNKDEEKKFIKTVKEILKVDQPVKIIISIREEYLGHIYQFEREVPELLRKKLRVENMNRDKVVKVIQKITRNPHSLISIKSGEEISLPGAVFDKINGQEKNISIPLPYLQVFLDRLYLQITADETRQESAEFSLAKLKELNDIGDVLRDFLDKQVFQVAKTLNQSPETIWQILSPFVTIDETKEPLSIEGLQNRMLNIDHSVLQSTLQTFVKCQILRYSDQNQLYEIAHDSLAKQIHLKRTDDEVARMEVRRLIKAQTNLNKETREYFSEKQLLFIESFIGNLSLKEEELEWIKLSKNHWESENIRKDADRVADLIKTKRRLTRLRSLLALAAIFLIFAGYFFIRAKKANIVTQGALSKAEKLVDAFYFYEGKYALANKGKRFYYIDTLGNNIKHLREWDRAEQFDEATGLAKVSNFSGNYLLDIEGRTYKLASRVEQINSETEAIDFRGLPFKKGLLDSLKLTIGLKIFLVNKVKKQSSESQVQEDELKSSKNSQANSSITTSRITALQADNNNSDALINSDTLLYHLLAHKDLKILLLNDYNVSSIPPDIKFLDNLEILDLSNNDIQYIPKDIKGTKSLKWLNLSSNRISNWTEELDSLNKLEKLHLSSNEISSISQGVGSLVNLTELILFNNNINSIPPAIGKLKNLSELSLSNNNIEKIPPTIGNLKKLSKISFSNNNIERIPKEIENLKLLKYLFLDNNKILNLPQEIEGLENLVELFLNNNKIQTIVPELGSLKNLTGLHLDNNEIRIIPREIGMVKRLTGLSLKQNDIQSIPKELGNLNHLEGLYLNSNDIQSIPREIKNLKSLIVFELSENKLKSIPTEIGALKSLTRLYINDNDIQIIPEALMNLKTLKDLDLSQNKLKIIPVKIAHLKNLSGLNLSQNKLKEIPEEIGKLRNLTEFLLSKNHIHSIPPELANLKSLIILDLSENKLTDFPKGICELNNLEYLLLNENNIESIPTEIRKLKSLRLFNLSGNPIPIATIKATGELLPYNAIRF